jgi:hypothetical protein
LLRIERSAEPANPSPFRPLFRGRRRVPLVFVSDPLRLPEPVPDLEETTRVSLFVTVQGSVQKRLDAMTETEPLTGLLSTLPRLMP